MNYGIKLGIGVAAIIGVMLAAGRGCNNYFNNQKVSRLESQTVSYATGLTGHHEFTLYTDGTSDMKIYPSYFGHRWGASKYYEDTNGDRKVDKIRINGPEWKMHKIEDIFTRNKDYLSQKKKFDEADSIMAHDRKILENNF